MSTESELKKLEKEIKQDVDSQAQLALQDPFPEPKELVSDIFAPNTPIVLRNVEFNDNLHLP